MQLEKIFISYRRDDTSGYARAIYQHLVSHLGEAAVFMDLESLTPGVDFAEQVRKELANTKLMLVLIGDNWVGTRTGQYPRIQDANDFVRLEVSIGLASDISVIPVLLGNASMPLEGDVPEEIKPLLRRQAAQVTHRRFIADMEPIVSMSAAAVSLDSTWHKIRRRTLLVVRWVKTGRGAFNTLVIALVAAMAAVINFVPPWHRRLWPVDVYVKSMWQIELPVLLKIRYTWSSIEPFSWVLICLAVQFLLLVIPATIKKWRISLLSRTVTITAITHGVLLLYAIVSSIYRLTLGGMESFRKYPDQRLIEVIGISILFGSIGLAVWEFHLAKRLKDLNLGKFESSPIKVD